MKIIIYSQHLVSMDGVGNSSIYFENLFKSFSEVLLVANYSNIDRVLNFKEYCKKHSPNNILFFHYSIEDLNIKLLLELKFKKRIIYFHGITPPKFFHPESEIFNSCHKGLNDIKLISDFDLYLSNSTESKNQFLDKVNHNFKDYQKFINMPPLDLFSEKNRVKKSKSIKSELNFYYCGTLVKHKNINSLLDLFNKNFKNQINLSIFTSFSKEECLNFLGEFKYKEYLENGINFFNKLEDEQMNTRLKTMDCFITLSLHEGFCIPLFNSINNFNPGLSFPLKCLEDYFPKEYQYISIDDNLEVIQEKYHNNHKNIEKFRDYIKNKAKGYTKTGLDLILKTIE